MKFKEAVRMAVKLKCRLKSKSLQMYIQKASDLLYWITEKEGDESTELSRYLSTTDWEMDFTGFKYHLRVVENCSPKTMSFRTNKERDKYLNNFKVKYGSLDDGDDNYIDLEFDGVINFDNLGKV